MTVTSGFPDPFGEQRRRIEELMRAFKTPAFDAQISAVRDAMKIAEPTRQLLKEFSALSRILPDLKASNLHPAVAALPTVSLGVDARKHLEKLTASFMPKIDARIWKNFQLPHPLKINAQWLEEQAAAVERLRTTLEDLEEDELPDPQEDAGVIGDVISGLDSLLSLLRVPSLTVNQKLTLLGLILPLLLYLHSAITTAQMHEEEMHAAHEQMVVLSQIAEGLGELDELEEQADEVEDLREQLDDVRAQMQVEKSQAQKPKRDDVPSVHPE